MHIVDTFLLVGFFLSLGYALCYMTKKSMQTPQQEKGDQHSPT